MKNNLSQKQIRGIAGKLYWQAHSDGQLAEHLKRAPDFGTANLTIEAASIELGCRPLRMKQAEFDKSGKIKRTSRRP